jgi:small-conductance mechanosensitive channel
VALAGMPVKLTQDRNKLNMDKPVTTEKELRQKIESQNERISSQNKRISLLNKQTSSLNKDLSLTLSQLQLTLSRLKSQNKKTNQTMSQSPQDIAWPEKQRRLLKAIADHAPFAIREDLTISALLSLALESLPECPQATKQEWLKNAVDSCLRGIQRTVLKEASQPDAIEVPRLLPVPIALAGGREPGPSDASRIGLVYGGFTRHWDPLRWHWHLTHYQLLENSGYTHWLPFDAECLPLRVEP